MEGNRSKLQCGFGLLGLCCLDCLRGPCRIVPFRADMQEGICGESADTIVAKNLLKRLATGTAISANYLYKLSGKAKLESTDWLKIGFTKQRVNLLSEYKILPDRVAFGDMVHQAILEALVPTSTDINELLLIGLRCALANLNCLYIISELMQIVEPKSLPQWCAREKSKIKNQKSKIDELQNSLVKRMKSGGILGIAIFVGCTELAQNEQVVYDELTKNGIMSLSLGCQDIGDSIGSCIDGARVASFVKELAIGLKIDVSLTPVMAIFCEQIDKRIEVMAYWMITLGIPVYWTKIPPIVGSKVVTNFFTKTVKGQFGGFFIWEKSKVQPQVAELVKILEERVKNSGLKPL